MADLVGNTFFGLDLGKLKQSWAGFRRRISKRVLLIDFDLKAITVAEVQVRNEAITVDHIRRYPLPAEALERGIPTEPAQMAALIRAHCQDQDIPAHRAAVVIAPDAVFTTVVQLPAAVAPEDALAHALDPASAVQVPIQLDQTDVELLPLDLPQSDPEQRSYFLTAVPRKLVDRLVETVDRAGLELLRLQMGTIAQLNLVAGVMAQLDATALLMHVELLDECSLVSLVSRYGPLKLVRLTAIREFPEPELEPEQQGSEPAMVINESQIVASDRYLPLSEMDLRRLSLELKQLIRECELQYSWLQWHGVVLAGPSSAHPMLAPLLQEAIGLPVELSRPLAATGVGTVLVDQSMVLQSLGRLMGLGLSFLERSTASVQTSSAEQEPDPEPMPTSDSEVAVVEDLLPALEVAASEPEPVLVVVEQRLADEPEPLAPEALPMVERQEPQTLVEAVFSQQPELVEVAPEVSEPEPEAPEPEEPIFRFSLAEPQEPAAVEESRPQRVEAAIADAPASADVDSSPFSMGDLLSSFAARQDQQPQESLPESVHLSDDPALWPSVVKNPPLDSAALANQSDND
jgi:Tfp pilus assembly PilM family ATPase